MPRRGPRRQKGVVNRERSAGELAQLSRAHCPGRTAVEDVATRPPLVAAGKIAVPRPGLQSWEAMLTPLLHRDLQFALGFGIFACT